MILLQETLHRNTNFKLSGYNTFSKPADANTNRGLMILIKNSIPTSHTSPPDCGEGVEVQAVKIKLLNQNLTIYNLYKSHRGLFEGGELFAQAAEEQSFIGGDFNAHHTILNSPGRNNADGEHIAYLLGEFPNIELLNNGEPTHIRGGRLDLSFTNSSLKSKTKWQVHSHLTSDHFATKTTITLEKLPPIPPPPARWDQDRADWNKFQQSLANWHASYTPPPNNINALTADLVAAFTKAADDSMPKTKPAKRNYNDSWYYCQEVKEAKQRVNRTRKLYRKRPTEANRTMLREVVKDTHKTISAIKTNKWLEWCAQLNQYTNISQLWQWLKRVSGKRTPKQPTHPQPKQEAERLAESFAIRSASNQLPPSTIEMQNNLSHQRWNTIHQACAQQDDTDAPFTLQELRGAQHKGKNTAPG